MQRILSLFIVLLVTASVAQADVAADRAAITQTALVYMQSWYQGDARRMDQSLHPKLAKRSLSASGKEVRELTAAQMVSYTGQGYGKGMWQRGQKIQAVILDLHGDIASAKIVTPHYYEYMHLAKVDGRWVILNTLYVKHQ